MIKDSGERRAFDTGAVRDITEGKGRCDLMPLDVVAWLMDDNVIGHIAKRQYAMAIDEFCHVRGWSMPDMLLEVSMHFAEGAAKYGEYNWQKGIPESCYVDSAVRHYLKWLRKDDDEPHDRAFCWNMLCCIWEMKHHKTIKCASGCIKNYAEPEKYCGECEVRA